MESKVWPSLRPVVDHARCEGKRACVAVCPFHVFEVRRIDDSAGAFEGDVSVCVVDVADDDDGESAPLVG